MASPDDNAPDPMGRRRPANPLRGAKRGRSREYLSPATPPDTSLLWWG